MTGADSGRRLVLPVDDGGILLVRYEPIGSPELVCRAMVGPGESLAHLVIRSDVGVATAQWAESNGVGVPRASVMSVPPKTSVQQGRAARHVRRGDRHRCRRRPPCTRSPGGSKGRLDSESARMLDGTNPPGVPAGGHAGRAVRHRP